MKEKPQKEVERILTHIEDTAENLLNLFHNAPDALPAFSLPQLVGLYTLTTIRPPKHSFGLRCAICAQAAQRKELRALHAALRRRSYIIHPAPPVGTYVSFSRMACIGRLLKEADRRVEDFPRLTPSHFIEAYSAKGRTEFVEFLGEANEGGWSVAKMRQLASSREGRE